MARTTINSQGVPTGTIVASDLSYPLTDFSSTGIDDNATSTAITIDSSENVGIGTATATYDLTVVGASNFSTIGTNDAALRLRADGARTMQFYTNSAEAMRINSTGNVGIGDSSPSVKFSVETSTSGNWAAVINNTHATNGFGLKVRAGDNSDVDSFRVADVDNVILYQIDGNGCVKVDPLGNTVGLSSLSIANNPMTIGSTTATNMAFDFNEIQVRNNGAADNLILQKNGGSLAVGTSSPTANCKLHVADADVQIELEATGTTPNNSGFINFDGTNLQLSTNRNMKDGSFSDSAKSNASLLLLGSSGGSTIRFYTANANNTTATERMRINSGGNISIGTTTDTYRLHVYHASNDAPLFIDSGSANGAHLRFGSSGTVKHYMGSGGGIGLGDNEDLTIRAFDNILVATGNSSTERMRIDSSGNLGIGTSSPERILHTSTSNDYVAKFESTDSFAGIILEDSNSTTNGNVIAASGDNMLFYTAGGQRLRLRSDGGICFNGDTAAANALDDYEEGTWSPTLTNGSYTITGATYTKIGRMVYAEALLTAFSDRSTASAVRVGGLPYNSSSTTRAGNVSLSRHINRSGDAVVSYLGTSRNYMHFYSIVANADYQQVFHSHLSSSSSNFYISLVYETS